MDNSESVSAEFKAQDLERAQAQTWAVLNEIKSQIVDGIDEPAAHQVAKQIFKKFEVEKIWHPTKIRFGENTLKTFSEVSNPNVKLKKGDLFFLDLGLVFYGHEGDCGQTFVLGQNDEAKKMILVCEKIFGQVKSKWKSDHFSGLLLYDFAVTLAQENGYEFNLRGASGHRIGDFPHAIHHKGSLRELERDPARDRWILEIQLKHKSLPMGAFFEDLLN